MALRAYADALKAQEITDTVEVQQFVDESKARYNVYVATLQQSLAQQNRNINMISAQTPLDWSALEKAQKEARAIQRAIDHATSNLTELFPVPATPAA